MTMKFTRTGPTSGDCTTPYSVTDYKAQTVGEFIEEVLQDKNEWGYVKVCIPDCSWLAYPSCEYRYGSIVDELDSSYLEKKIKSVDASGGWTFMAYYITTED